MKPTIVMTMGDPAGIGPEVVVKALADPETVALADWKVVGDRGLLERTAEACGVASLPAEIVETSHGLPPNFEVGKPAAGCGAAAVSYVKRAAEMCVAGEAEAMVTAPLNKEAVQMGGMRFSGHTEYIAEVTKARDSRMLLVNERLAVVHVTTHVSLRRATEATQPRVLRTLELGWEALQWMGKPDGRIAVCGLNPHAGENGLFGAEDADVIAPAIEAARERGIPCEGPVPADTVFLKAVRGAYEMVVAMYHDQGHIPMKLLDFEHTVNVSLGLPIIRTSVDHGTAFDIAGTGQADGTNMKAAMRLAVTMAANRAAVQTGD